MKTRLKRLSVSGLVLACLACLVSLAACGLTAPRGSEGFAELDSPGVFDTDNSVTISIGPTLLRFAAAHLDEDEPEAKALLKDLDGVRIRVYEVERNSAKVANRIDAMQARLLEVGWEPVMLVREENEVTHLLVKFRDDRILGLTLLAMENANAGGREEDGEADGEGDGEGDGESGGEVVVINLMGEIRPQNFSRVMVALDVDKQSARNVQVAHAN